jgi:hypothetical protein
MSILDKIFGRQSGGKKPETSPSDKWAVFYYVRCAKCGEVIRVRLDRRNDFEQQFDENGHDEVAGYRVHKEVMGSGNCFKMMALEIKFDRYFPHYLQALIADVASERSAISKYVMCRRYQPI